MTSNSQQLLTTIANKIFRSATKTRNKYNRLRILRFVAKFIVFLAAFTHAVRKSLDKREICRFREFDCNRNTSTISNVLAFNRFCSFAANKSISKYIDCCSNKCTNRKCIVEYFSYVAYSKSFYTI
jgi:hypothetical protein